MANRREQLTICLEPPLREFIERKAAAEDRSVSAQVRRLVAEAMRPRAGPAAEPTTAESRSMTGPALAAIDDDDAMKWAKLPRAERLKHLERRLFYDDHAVRAAPITFDAQPFVKKLLELQELVSANRIIGLSRHEAVAALRADPAAFAADYAKAQSLRATYFDAKHLAELAKSAQSALDEVLAKLDDATENDQLLQALGF